METFHLLLGISLQESTRTLVTVDCRPLESQFQMEVGSHSGIRNVQSIYTKYLQRPENHEELTYFMFLTTIDSSRKPWRSFPRAKPRVLDYFPRYKPNREADEFEQYSRVRLMLHRNHRTAEDLKAVESTIFSTYKEVFQNCLEIHPSAHPEDYYSDLPLPPPEDFEEHPKEKEQDITNEERHALAQQLPGQTQRLKMLKFWETVLLTKHITGKMHVGQHSDLLQLGQNYWKQLRTDVTPFEEESANIDIELLKPEQRLAYDLFVNHLRERLDPFTPNPPLLRVQIDGP